jgi:hypothetical protein
LSQSENSGENCTAPKECIIGNDVGVACLFLAYAQLAGICTADCGLDGASRFFAAVEGKHNTADADEAVDAPADSAKPSWLSKVLGQRAKRGIVLSALRAVAQQLAAADSTGAVCTAAGAKWNLNAHLDFAGGDWVGGIYVLEIWRG